MRGQQVTINKEALDLAEQQAKAEGKTLKAWLEDAIFQQASHEQAEAQGIDLDYLRLCYEKRGIDLTPKELAKKGKACQRFRGITAIAEELNLTNAEIMRIAFADTARAQRI